MKMVPGTGFEPAAFGCPRSSVATMLCRKVAAPYESDAPPG